MSDTEKAIKQNVEIAAEMALIMAGFVAVVTIIGLWPLLSGSEESYGPKTNYLNDEQAEQAENHLKAERILSLYAVAKHWFNTMQQRANLIAINRLGQSRTLDETNRTVSNLLSTNFKDATRDELEVAVERYPWKFERLDDVDMIISTNPNVNHAGLKANVELAEMIKSRPNDSIMDIFKSVYDERFTFKDGFGNNQWDPTAHKNANPQFINLN
jgi:hypothetical protein